MNPNAARVSIGLPVYNGEQYLADAISSILQQTYTSLELIISDNASTDRTERICRDYAVQDRRIRYYRNERNLGAAANYNQAFALSTGEYFKWAAHDDICGPEFIEKCVRILEEDSSVVLCYPRTCIINEIGTPISDFDDGFHLMGPTPSTRLRESFLAGSWIFHPIFGVIRRTALEATPLIGKYDGADFVLLAYLALAGKCFELPDRLFFRREHDQRCCKVARADMPQWWSTSNRSRFYFRHWRRVREYLRAVHSQDIPVHEKSRCLKYVARWAYWHRPHLMQDLNDAAKTALGMLLVNKRLANS